MPEENDALVLRDILNRLESLPTRHEFQNLVNELKDFVTKSEFNAYKDGIESRIKTNEDSFRTTKGDVERLKAQRLPSWALSILICIATLFGQYFISHSQAQPVSTVQVQTTGQHK